MKVKRHSKVAVDIGSTVVKLALLAGDDTVVDQQFHARDSEAGIFAQVEALLDAASCGPNWDEVAVCSSANGGLRVGIVCLSKHFSGAALREQVLLAGANPVFVHDFEDNGDNTSYVDILLVGGGIDCDDAAPMEQRLNSCDLSNYRYGSLVFAGNRYLADLFCARFPVARVAPNPLAEHLVSRSHSVFELVRRAYLDDLVYKEGVTELSHRLGSGIRPTPELVNAGFQRLVTNRSSIVAVSPCILLDIGGATTDLHYTAEIVTANGASTVPPTGYSVSRYVFTDLGIVASRPNLTLVLRAHPRLYELTREILTENVTERYRLFREGEYEPSPQFLAYGCLFLALERFAQGRSAGLPSGDLSKLNQLVLTGGGAQTLSEPMIARVVDLVLPANNNRPSVLVDRDYRVWVEGISWSERAVAASVS
jgi:hypothetical protein